MQQLLTGNGKETCMKIKFPVAVKETVIETPSKYRYGVAGMI